MFECDSQIQIQSWMNKSYRVYFGVKRQSFFNGHAFQILQGPNHSNVNDLTMPKQNLKNAKKTWYKMTQHPKQWTFKIMDMYTQYQESISWTSETFFHHPIETWIELIFLSPTAWSSARARIWYLQGPFAQTGTSYST